MPIIVSGQSTSVCTPAAFNAMKALPELTYVCDDSLADFDEKLLKTSTRLQAIRSLTSTLGSFTHAAWWNATVTELNACDLLRSPGALSEEQSEDFRSGNYVVRLFGDDRVRMVVITDPCYQTGYGGSNLFLLNRDGNRVHVIEALDGFYSRADNAVGLHFADLQGERIVEISTGTGGLQPYITNYYFTVDPISKQIVPKNLFRVGRRASHKITSAVVMSELPDLKLPKDATELQVIANGKLAPQFSAYGDDASGKIDDNGRMLTRKIFRWNGRFYSIARRAH